MTEAKSSELVRRHARGGDSRVLQMLRVAASLAAAAERDSSISGATVILAGGETRWLSLSDALAMLGPPGAAAGSA